ncbi:MAG TPA: ABC transporter permease [Solirubrobacteraceae bacterium]|nr:ABC transporter permease [Solirubrobacteraceae bacterium]
MPASDQTAQSSSHPPAAPPTPPAPSAPLFSLRHTAASAPIWLATAALFLISLIFEPDSVRHSALLGMLPFAAVLAIAAMGQTLVVQQGGIDLSVPGMISLTIVLLTSYPNGDSGKLASAIVIAFAAVLAAGAISGVIVSVIGVTPIVATLGMNAVLYGVVIQVSAGNPPPTTNALARFAGGKLLGIPNAVIIAIILTALVALVIKRTIVGRRFEAVGSGLLGARAAGLRARRYQLATYVVAAALYCTAGILLAGIVHSPSAFQGDSYLLPTVAAVVLGGTSLLGGRGSVIATAVAALFITQLDQFVLVMGANQGVQNLVDAGALAVGLAIYSVPWRRLRRNARRPSVGGASRLEQSTEPGLPGL